jgi:hypothetical protein
MPWTMRFEAPQSLITGVRGRSPPASLTRIDLLDTPYPGVLKHERATKMPRTGQKATEIGPIQATQV